MDAKGTMLKPRICSKWEANIRVKGKIERKREIERGGEISTETLTSPYLNTGHMEKTIPPENS